MHEGQGGRRLDKRGYVRKAAPGVDPGREVANSQSQDFFLRGMIFL
jgi:hypothetical protein